MVDDRELHVPNVSECVVLAIDVQREFCDASYIGTHDRPRGTAATDKVAQRIARRAPQMRQRGLQLAWVYTIGNAKKSHKPFRQYGGFHRVKPCREQDLFFGKYEDSAFGRTGRGKGLVRAFNNIAHSRNRNALDKYMRRNGKTTILACGFNLSACVRETVISALSLGHNAILLTDLSANDSENPPTSAGLSCFGDKVIWERHNQFRDQKHFGICGYLTSDVLLKQMDQGRHITPQQAYFDPQRSPAPHR